MTSSSTKGDGQDRALPPAEDRAVVNGAASVSALRASVPSALCAAIAAEFNPYIAKLVDKRFTGGHLGRAVECEDTARGAAVCAVDCYHGFTCEFSPWPNQHVSEYDLLEQMLEYALSGNAPACPEWTISDELAQAIEARRAETGTGSVHESAVGSADAPKDTLHDK